MGRTHKKEATFARAADHLGFVKKADFFEAMKAILAVLTLPLPLPLPLPLSNRRR